VPAAPIRYTLRFPAPHTHYVDVEAVYPTDGAPHVDLFMAVWTPGSYLVREYARHVEGVTARALGGEALAVWKTAKNRWRLETRGAASVRVHYRVYGREMSVRTNWIEHAFAMINGAPTFISAAGALSCPHEVRLELPSHWSTSTTALAPLGEPHAYRADDFDTLVDSPIVLGNTVVRAFVEASARHVIAFEGDTAHVDADRIAEDTRQIVETCVEMMGGRVDYPHYYFLNMLVDAGGGLEHKNSFVVMANRFVTRTRQAYVDYLRLVAHEYFHVWNGKRSRPIELGPFDYEREVYTTALWIVEGFTEYYAGLIVKRAGLDTRDEFLDDLSDHIETVQSTPGRFVTSAALSSFDAWIKQYRPDENTANTTVNYYPKGAVIAFLLDAHIRRSSDGDRSLDDAMRLAYARFAGDVGYTVAQWYDTMSDAAGVDLRGWLAHAAETTEELEYCDALDWFGLRFRALTPRAPRAWLGVATRVDGGRVLVSHVRRDTPAHAEGLNVDDEIVAIDEVRVRAETLASRLERYAPGDRATLLVGRRERLIPLDVTLVPEPGRPWRLEVVPHATAEQRQRLARWLGDSVSR
jgi:predicted metalloprotease with PDZ domain